MYKCEYCLNEYKERPRRCESCGSTKFTHFKDPVVEKEVTEELEQEIVIQYPELYLKRKIATVVVASLAALFIVFSLMSAVSNVTGSAMGSIEKKIMLDMGYKETDEKG